MRILTAVLLALSCMVSSHLAAQPAEPAPPPVELAGGFSEAVIVTGNSAAWSEMLTSVAGWEVRDRARLSRAELRLWNLPETSSGNSVLLANTGENRGYIRLIELQGAEQSMIRADDRPWDIGGIFDLNLRVTDMEATRKALHARGWQGDSEPIRYVFGPFEVVEWIARGPDGVRLAFIQRIKPELKDWPNLKRISRVFNATSIVRDGKATRSFFEDVLGMKPYLLSNKPSDEAGANVLGLPHNVATMISRDVSILHPSGVNEGSVEFVQFVGGWGSDFSARAARHNLGISTLRFPVNDLDTAIMRLRAHDVPLSGEPVTVERQPYGRIRSVGLQTPDGIWLELFERAK